MAKKPAELFQRRKQRVRFKLRQTGKLVDVVTRYGGWGDRQILICGGPEMVRTTKAALIAKGAPPERSQHDPLYS